MRTRKPPKRVPIYKYICPRHPGKQYLSTSGALENKRIFPKGGLCPECFLPLKQDGVIVAPESALKRGDEA